MKSAVVIGASSMLGQELVRQLSAAGVDVIRAGRSAGNEIILDLDLYTLKLPDVVPQPDAVFHCAAAFEGDNPSGLRKNLRINTSGSALVLNLMQHLNTKVCIYAGSIGSGIGVEYERGRSGYGLSKALGEQILSWGLTERSPDGRFCSIRFPQLFDTEGKCCQQQPWFGRIIAYASRGMDLNLPPEDGTRNFLHIRDAANLMILAAQYDLSGAWNACHPDGITHAQLARCAYRAFSRGGVVKTDDRKAAFRKIAIPDGSPLLERLGVQPEISMVKGLEMIRDAGTAKAFGPLDVS